MRGILPRIGSQPIRESLQEAGASQDFTYDSRYGRMR